MYPFAYHRPASLDDAKAHLAASADGRLPRRRHEPDPDDALPPRPL